MTLCLNPPFQVHLCQWLYHFFKTPLNPVLNLNPLMAPECVYQIIFFYYSDEEMDDGMEVVILNDSYGEVDEEIVVEEREEVSLRYQPVETGLASNATEPLTLYMNMSASETSALV